MKDDVTPIAKQRLTRAEASAYLREAGFPISDSTMDKWCSPARGEGPPACAFWGKRPLYSPEQLLAWAEARLRRPQAA
jgi:hypothetical protein